MPSHFSEWGGFFFLINMKLNETQISDFVIWAKGHGITFRGAEVRRANKGEESTKAWKLLFSLFLGGAQRSG